MTIDDWKLLAETDQVKFVNKGVHEMTLLLVGERYIRLSPGASAWVKRVRIAGRHLFCDCEDGCAFCDGNEGVLKPEEPRS